MKGGMRRGGGMGVGWRERGGGVRGDKGGRGKGGAGVRGRDMGGGGGGAEVDRGIGGVKGRRVLSPFCRDMTFPVSRFE